MLLAGAVVAQTKPASAPNQAAPALTAPASTAERAEPIALISAASAAAAQKALVQVLDALQGGQNALAIKLIDDAVKANANHPVLFYLQAQIYATNGNKEGALSALATAEQLAPGLPFVRKEAVKELRDSLAAASSSHYIATAIALLSGGLLVLLIWWYSRKGRQTAAADADVTAQPTAASANLAATQDNKLAAGAQPESGPSPGPHS